MRSYGLKRLPIHDPYAAPIGAVLVYGNKDRGHVEIRTKDGFVSDYQSKYRCFYPLIAVYGNSGPENLDSGVNKEIDFFRERIGNFADHIAAKQIDQRVSLRRPENETRRSERRGDVDNRLGGGRTDGVGE